MKARNAGLHLLWAVSLAAFTSAWGLGPDQLVFNLGAVLPANPRAREVDLGYRLLEKFRVANTWKITWKDGSQTKVYFRYESQNSQGLEEHEGVVRDLLQSGKVHCQFQCNFYSGVLSGTNPNLRSEHDWLCSLRECGSWILCLLWTYWAHCFSSVGVRFLLFCIVRRLSSHLMILVSTRAWIDSVGSDVGMFRRWIFCLGQWMTSRG